jgi:hypothetical protein
MNVSEAEILEAAQAVERAALTGQSPAEAGVLVDALEEGHRLFCDLLVSRPGSRAVGKIWNLSADELRLIVLSRLIAQTLETAASTLGSVVANKGPLN